MQSDALKWRTEQKYIADERSLSVIEGRIAEICQLDNHAANGIYTIRSLYFDTFDNRFLYENIDGTDYREKYRIRIYNGDISNITLECKVKQNGKNRKESVRVSKEFVDVLLQGGIPDVGISDNKCMNRFRILYDTEYLRPKTIVSYERTPYVFPIGNVRVTFDRNISGSNDISNFLSGDFLSRPVMPQGKSILEVKYDEFLPGDIQNMLQVDSITQTAFSKYYYCRHFCG